MSVKKFLAGVICAVLLCSLTACGGHRPAHGVKSPCTAKDLLRSPRTSNFRIGSSCGHVCPAHLIF